MIEVPFQLTIRETPAIADAYLLLSPCNLVNACAELNLSQLPNLFAVSGGVLIVPATSTTFEPKAAIRLRRLGGQFYIPANADLSPGLLPDEVRSLTSQQGLIVLPGGDVLAFQPQSPLAVQDWLASLRVIREVWQPFPPRSPRPEKLTRIERPSDTPAAVIESLNAGRPDDAEPLDGPGEATGPIPEDARPPTASLGQRIGAGVTLAAAKALAAAGKLLQNPKLAQLGGKLARKAMEQVPRLTEKILGAQEAALRNILKQLQSGNIEEALRRAPAAVGDPDTPARVDTSNRLATKDPRYSLRSLLGGGTTGGASVWLGGGDVWQQLAAEYRRLAQEALKRGDFRRAAYLYGVLLRDLRSAANALAAGGLHRDAAVLYRDKLNDHLAAAQQFERAGDIDEAVRIFERLGKHEDAAELLRRAGDEERATGYFLEAARVHSEGRRWIAAGDLVRLKIGRRDLARDYYRRGWDDHGAETVACGERLLDEHVLAEEWDDVTGLAYEAATDRFVPPRATDAGRFFNYALKLSELVPTHLISNLRDTARGLFADHLRSASNGPHLAGQLFGSGNPWPPEVVRDAIYATRRVKGIDKPAATPEPPVSVTDGTVVAVVTARTSRDLIIATTTKVICWRAADDTVQPIFNTGKQRRVLGLATDDTATSAYVLYGEGVDLYLRCISLGRNGRFEQDGQVKFENVAGSGTDWYLKPTVVPASKDDPANVVALTNRHGCFTYKGPQLSACVWPLRLQSQSAVLIADDAEGRTWIWDHEGISRVSPNQHESDSVRAPWVSGMVPQNCMTTPRLDWIVTDDNLEVVGIDKNGHLNWVELSCRLPNLKSTHRSIQHDAGYLAACLLGPGVIAAANTLNEIVWLVTRENTILPMKPPTKIRQSLSIVALSVLTQHEIVAVLANGTLARIRRP